MKSKYTKKAISILLSLILVATAIPMGGFIAQAGTSWSVLASSDFSTVNSVSQDTAFSPSTYVGGNSMTWTPHDYTSSASVDSTNGGISIPDGYMYLSGYTGGSVPITGHGANGWKVDVGFRFTTTNSGDDKYYNSDNYSFLKMYVYETNLSNPNRKNAGYCYFQQNANGVGYSWEGDNSVGSQSQATSITTGNGNLVKDTNYHYVAEYTVNRFRAYITDANGKIVQLVIDTTNSTFLGRLANIGPNGANTTNATINAIKLGDDDNSYYFKGLEYQNITFYEGTEVTDASTAGQPNNASDKYVMAYFTGNYNRENESLRYAVSTDGINFHALNKGLPVTSIDNPTGLTVYPTGTAQSANATGNIRDPYILRKQDGSGFYILATDLDTGANGFNNNSKMLVWDVEHLQDVTTTRPWAIDIRSMMQPIVGDDGSGNPAWIHRAWAPEAFYDSAKGKYFMHFSARANNSTIDAGTYLYGVYTSDFKSFDGTPKRLINTGADNIDASINYNSSDDLYYMWYKNESNSKLWYATATNADGPYVNVSEFSYNLGVEGPEIFRNLANDGWIFLCDAFGESADPATSKQGVFQAFTSSSITGFSSTTSTNIPYLYARHAGVTRVTNAEYEALIAAFGGEIADGSSTTKARYYFSGNTSHSGTGWLGSVKDPGEQIFKVAHDDAAGSSYSTSMGVLSLNNTSVFMQDDNIRTMLKSNAFTVNFKCKITDSNLLSNSDMPIAAIGNINKDYIRLETDGEFYVAGTKVASGFNPQVNTEYNISISFNGTTASLFVDGDYVTGLVQDETVVDPSGAQCYLALGWTDTCGETDRISADYSDLTIVNTALPVTDEDPVFDYADDVIEAYENKMENSTVYRNLEEAYKRYVDVNEARDAVLYGNSTTAQLYDAAKALKTATANMTAWSEPTASARVQFRDETDTYVDPAYAKNILYASKGYSPSYYNTSNINIEVDVNQYVVALYRGGADNNASSWAILIPAMVGCNNQEGGTGNPRKLVAAYPSVITAGADHAGDTSNFTLQSNWYGRITSNIYSWQNAWDANSDRDCNGINSTGFSINGKWVSFTSGKDMPRGNTGTWYGYANYMRYVGDESFTNRLKTINQDWTVFATYKQDNNRCIHDWDDAQTIYIIDYRNVESTINSYKATLQNVTQYKEGGLLAFVQAFDKLTIDVDGADYASNPGTTAATVASTLETGVSTISTAAASLNDAKDSTRAGYIALRDAIDTSGVPSAISSSSSLHNMLFTVRGLVASEGRVTVDGHDLVLQNYSAFKTAYDNAAGEMARLGTAGYNTNRTSNYTNISDASDYADALVDAFNALDLTFTVTYTKNGGSSSNETLEVGQTLASIPANTATAYDDNNYHNVYTWPANVTSSYVPWSDESYTEVVTPTACDHNTARAHTAADGNTNGYTDYECSVCGHCDTTNRIWDNRSADWASYKTAAAAVATNYADTNYTTSSRSAYKTAADAITATVNPVDDETKSESYIDGKTDALTAVMGLLNHVANFTALDSAVTAATTDRATNNYDNSNNQINTYTSWTAFATAYDNANGYYTKTAEQRADTPMYATDGSGYVTSDLSTDQTNINNYKNALTSATLVSINTDSLDTYETARSVITASLDTKKYTDDALSHVNGAINDANAEVYHTLTAAEATAYSTSTGGRTFVAGDKVRNVESADTQTTAIMTAVDEINDADDKDEYIKKYTVTFSVQDDDGEPLGTGLINDVEKSSDTIYYGDSFKLAVPDSLKNGRKITKWSTTYTEEDGATLSQKATGRLGSEITKIANSDMAVTAELTATSPQSGETYRYDICNAYGDVTNIIYSNTDVHGDKSDPTFTIDGVTIEAKKVPMYTCVGWTCSQVGENYYKFVPVLDNVPTYNFTVYGSVGSSSLVAVPYDEKVTLEYDTTFSTGTFAAWAVKTGSGKLQIASYSPNYYYYACANETYVPIVNTSNSDTPVYKYYNGSSWLNVTASSIEGSIANVEGADLDSVVTAKISNKVPFISIENVKMTETQARVFVRFTEGSTVDGSSFGVLYRQNEGTDEQMRIGYTGTVRRNITSYVSSGQFTFTINNKSGAFSPSLTSVTFRAFVNYDLEYTADGDKAKINGLDYSVVSNAPRS